jgi:hypothetical protein
MPRTDLTGYAALFGESLSSKADLLDRLIGDAHYPSLGQYKERLLADAIRGFLPRTVEVGTGFVMFPHADMNPPGGVEFHDPLNQSAYSMSPQCDILVYDVARYPTVFRDGDFVVIRPEAVRAVIEVKGSLTIKETRKALSACHNFAVKWRDTQLFYRERYVPLTRKPPLFVMAWRISRDAAGRPRTTPSAVCKAIAKFYAENVELSEVDGYPFLEELLIHNEARILVCPETEPKGKGKDYRGPLESAYAWHFGSTCLDGQFVRFRDGSVIRGGDRTIAALLASLHWAIAEEGRPGPPRPLTDFNRFISYQDEVRDQNALPYKYSGSSRAWSDLSQSDLKRIMSEVPCLPEPE